MNIYEELVQLYLTSDQDCFVIPQFEVKEGDWKARLDFLVLDVNKQCIHVVEVSKAATPRKATHLAGMLRGRHRSYVETFIERTINRHLHYPIHWHFFVRRVSKESLEHQAAVRDYIDEEGKAPQVTAIEDVFDAIRDRMPDV